MSAGPLSTAGKEVDLVNVEDRPVEQQFTTHYSYKVDKYSIILESNIRAEILDASQLSTIPFTPSWCLGLTSVRGELYPVLDMHKVLLGTPRPENLKLLLIEHAQFPPIILSCDHYASVQNLPAYDLSHPIKKAFPEWVLHSFDYQQQAILVVDHARLLRDVQRDSTTLSH